MHHQVCHQDPPQIPAGKGHLSAGRHLATTQSKIASNIECSCTAKLSSPVVNGSAQLVAGVTMTVRYQMQVWSTPIICQNSYQSPQCTLGQLPAALKEQGCMHYRSATAETHGVAHQDCSQNATDTLCNCMQLQSSQIKIKAVIKMHQAHCVIAYNCRAHQPSSRLQPKCNRHSLWLHAVAELINQTG